MLRHRFGVALTAALAWTGQAWAALPPDTAAVQDAPYHVQIAVTGVSLHHAEGENAISTCSVSGRVVRIFRDKHGDLAPKAPVSFGLPCVPPEDNVVLNPGPLYYFDADALQQAKVIEVILDRQGDQFFSVEDQYYLEVLDAPTEAPAVQVP